MIAIKRRSKTTKKDGSPALAIRIRARIIRPMLAALLAITPGTSLFAGTPADSDVLGVVDALFDAMREKDGTALKQLFTDDARLGKNPVDGWIKQVSVSKAYLDEVTYDETVMIDEDLAMAWTPYTIYIDGDLHHCGIDVFLMRRDESAWKIFQLDDTRRTTDCPDPGGSASEGVR